MKKVYLLIFCIVLLLVASSFYFYEDKDFEEILFMPSLVLHKDTEPVMKPMEVVEDNYFIEEMTFYIGSNKWYFNREEQIYSDNQIPIKPIVREDVILLPIGSVLKKFGQDVMWDSNKKMMSATLFNEKFVLSIKKKNILLGNRTYFLKNDIKIYNNQLYISAEDIAEIFNLNLYIKNGVISFISPLNDLEETMDYYISQYNDTLSNEENVEKLDIPVLMYHLCLDSDVSEDMEGMAVTIEEFDEHLQFLTDAGYEGISFEQYYNYKKFGASLPSKPIIITFDDGYENNYTNAFPILKKHNMKSTIFIVTSVVGEEGVQYSHMTWEHMKEMEDSGLVTIHNHGYIHMRMDRISKKDMNNNVLEGNNSINKNLGVRQIYVFAYPYLRNNILTRYELEKIETHIQVTGLGDNIDQGTKLSNIKRKTISHGISGEQLLELIHE